MTKAHHIMRKDHKIIPKAHQIMTKAHHIMRKDHKIIPKPHQIIRKAHQIIRKAHQIMKKNPITSWLKNMICYNNIIWYDAMIRQFRCSIYMYQGELRYHPSFLNFIMVAYFCSHLSYLNVDLSYLHADLPLFHLLENKSQ